MHNDILGLLHVKKHNLHMQLTSTVMLVTLLVNKIRKH